MPRMPTRDPAIRLFVLASLAATLLASGFLSARAGPAPAAGVDLARLAGRWYLIARLPAEGPAFGAQVEYRLAGEVLDEDYAAHRDSLAGSLEKEEVQARPDPDMPSHWHIREGWLRSRERAVLYVSPGYRRAIVGDDRGAWLLAREPEIPEWSYAGMLARLTVQGYDVSKLRRVVQTPEQMGRPGFE
jgi:apolipoprotein D and lipocalin family protein